jgi:hypothetical protein
VPDLPLECVGSAASTKGPSDVIGRRPAPCELVSGVSKGVIGFLVARPLIALVIAAVVVGVLLLVQTHRQKTPVTHREERVGLTDKQQMQLGSEQYAKTLRQYRARIVASGPEYSEV